MARKPKVFVDSSVIFSALFSDTGASAAILKLASQKEIILLTSNYIKVEVRRTLSKKAAWLLPTYEAALDRALFQVVTPPTQTEVNHAQKLISDSADAPILAAAIKAKADCLVTLDKKHFTREIEVASGLRIVTPSECIKEISA